MKIKMRCEDRLIIYEIPDDEARVFAKSLGIDDYDTLDIIEKQEALQKIVDERFNRPEYNNYHKFNRHRGYVNKPIDTDTDEFMYGKDIMDTFPDEKIEDMINHMYSNDSVIRFFKYVFKKKPKFYDVMVSAFIYKESISEYASLINIDRTTVSHRYSAALDYIREKSKFDKKVYDFLHKK